MKTQITPSQLLNPSLVTAIALANLHGAEASNPKLIQELKQPIDQAIEQIKAGNLAPMEEVLVTQAIMLNSIFCNFIAKGSGLMGDPSFAKALPNYPKNLVNLALKAQNQCRSTIEAINELKNPKTTTFVKNQLNNLQLELEQLTEEMEDNAKKLDGGTEAIAVGKDSKLETLEILHRSENFAG